MAVARAREAGPQGVFELRLKKFHHLPTAAEDKECSGDSSMEAAAAGGESSARRCETKFRVCLKHYMAQVDGSSLCTFGEEVLTATGRSNNGTIHLPPVHFPIDFKWPVRVFSSYLGLTEAFDQVYYGEKGNRIPSILSTSF
jgi:hypothetical protein